MTPRRAHATGLALVLTVAALVVWIWWALPLDPACFDGVREYVACFGR